VSFEIPLDSKNANFHKTSLGSWRLVLSP
jgi:hypothetical protein